MARSRLCFLDIEAVRRLAPAEYEFRRFIKICNDDREGAIDFDDTIHEYEELGFMIRRKVFDKLWHGGWRGGYWNPSSVETRHAVSIAPNESAASAGASPLPWFEAEPFAGACGRCERVCVCIDTAFVDTAGGASRPPPFLNRWCPRHQPQLESPMHLH
jgi:hypothetical protein